VLHSSILLHWTGIPFLNLLFDLRHRLVVKGAEEEEERNTNALDGQEIACIVQTEAAV
jgi:hypothetical protein